MGFLVARAAVVRLTFPTLLAKDARLLARHRFLLVALLLYPLLLAGVLHAVFNAPPQKLSVAVLNEDSSEGVLIGNETLSSESLLSRVEQAANVHRVETRDEGLRLLRDGTVDAIVVIPLGFVPDLSRQGRGATLTLVVDAADPIRAGIASSAVRGYAQAFGQEIVERKVTEVIRQLAIAIEGGDVVFGGFDLHVQGLQETLKELNEAKEALPEGSRDREKVVEAIEYLEFADAALSSADTTLRTAAIPLAIRQESFARSEPKPAEAALPGALALSVFWTGALAAAALFASEGEAGTLPRMQASPTSAAARAGSKIVVALALVVLQGLLVVALAALVWEERPASPALAVPALALAGAAAAAFGALAAGLARGRAGSALLVVLATLPMTLLAGLFFPIGLMPQWVQAVARTLPLTHAVDAFRDVLVRGTPLDATLPALAALAAAAVVAGGAGAALLRGRV